MHRCIAARLVVYTISMMAAAILYQGTNSALYYLIGLGVYVWAYNELEVRETRSTSFVRAKS
jgi:hypothetical protein